MNENPDVRIGDTEREQALQALGEHMGAGRLTVDEYGDRSARVAAAKTRAELTALFIDLPEPHPKFTASWATVAQPAVTKAPATWADRPLGQRLVAAVIPLLFVGAVLVGVTTGFWYLIALPLATAAVGRSLWGSDWERGRQGRRDGRRRLGERDQS
ncbi:DUF1707 SHOCT-like domain-containing protein [Amycolatopsis taiwanensis]|uniref:DUF1707 domain-containing protein n=1 Tax=Amycolatopsis taiwanensis TaxID=342230 RepID=A0A9W6R6E3_9PSEU|nr:DUF1707 domain-containing protein [Amycolatopsis taiwanensis]GLY68447.1 hypothetical protein Atai01_50660 [Amycolatopsis taiwanensis]